MRARRTNRLRNRAGYTLTEMLVVLAIISFLAAILTPAVFTQLSRSRAKGAALQLETVGASLEVMKTDIGRYPTTEEGLALLVDNPTELQGWLGPYVRDQKALTDPWGRPLDYATRGKAGFVLSTLGEDGEPGGKSTAADQIYEHGR